MNKLHRFWSLLLLIGMANMPNFIKAQNCFADAGTLSTYESEPCFDGSATLNAILNGDRHVPHGFNALFVLTEGDGLVIQQVSAQPLFTVHTDGEYTIHTLVYDETLDLNVVQFGVTTGFDVLGLIEANGLCASLDAAGIGFDPDSQCNEGCAVIESFSFSNGNEDVIITDGGVYQINDLPQNFYVEAIVTGSDQSVRFLVSGEGYSRNKVENIVPYTYPKGGAHWDLGIGTFNVEALVYPFNNAYGELCDSDMISFTLTNGEDDVCEADAGTLTADMAEVCIEDGGMISATPNGDIDVPSGFSVLYVLTEGPELVIQNVNSAPEFTVPTAGNYTIHTLVYDETLDLSVVTLGETTGVDVLNIVIDNGLCASLDVAGAPVAVVDCPCEADAGTLTADMAEVCIEDGGMISATPNGDIDVPSGFSVLYVLTEGPELVIQNVNSAPEFTVPTAGNYTIHTLVYDETLDLSVVTLGETTGVDVLNIVIDNGLCASLDVAGAPVAVVDCPCEADAGTLTADMAEVCIEDGGMISATPNGDIDVPSGFSVLYVLTEGPELVIQNVNSAPEFTVPTAGNYTIHTLVYDETLDLSVVTLGETTGVDVLNIVIDNGLCASLDVAGAPVAVVDCPCEADAGTLTADMAEVCIEDGGMISATPNGDIDVPSGFSVLYVLTEGPELVIQNVNSAPEFTVPTAGNYTIHTLVYDETLDLSVVTLGETTGVDVLNIVIDNGLCASLDVAGAPVAVVDCPCEADAGTLTADMAEVCIEDGGMISATPNGDIDVPSGFSVLYVLTEGPELVIQNVNSAPEFTVPTAGNYTIHTLVYDETLDLSVVTLGETTGVDVLNIVIDNGLCASLDVAGAPVAVVDCPCEADAGTLTADMAEVCIEDGGMISATPNGDIDVPSGFSVLYVLTEGPELVIQNVNSAPEFTVPTAGNYTIHTLVYDETLDLSVVTLGETTGVDVLNIVIDNGLCASLDVAGAPVAVVDCNQCEAYSGKLATDDPIQCIEAGEAFISADVTTSPVIPEGYEQIYVLTKAFSLAILNVNSEPNFIIEQPGFYRIHSLVYDPSTLDLGIVEFGETTGFDVFGLTQEGGGNICASLGVSGAVFLVLPRWICQFFRNSKNLALSDKDMVDNLISRFDSYDEFEKSLVGELTEVEIFPNPAIDVLNLDVQNILSDEVLNISLIDGSGRVVLEKRQSLNTEMVLLDVSDIAPGRYVLNVQSERRNSTKAVVIRR